MRRILWQIVILLLASALLPLPFTVEEVNKTFSLMKAGNAAGPDGVLPECVKNLRAKYKKWLAILFSNIHSSVFVLRIRCEAAKPGKLTGNPL